MRTSFEYCLVLSCINRRKEKETIIIDVRYKKRDRRNRKSIQRQKENERTSKGRQTKRERNRRGRDASSRVEGETTASQERFDR